MNKILETAAGVSTPLALAGLIVGVLLLVFVSILRLRIIPGLDRNRGSQIIRNMIHWVGALAVIGILFGSATFVAAKIVDAKHPPDSYRGNIPANISLRMAARWLARTEEGFDAEFNSNCTDSTLSKKVAGGLVAAGNIAMAIEKLPRTLLQPEPRIRFRVIRSQERGVYEVECL